MASLSDRPAITELAPGLRTVGLSRSDFWDRHAVMRLLDREAPDLLVCRLPHRPALAWAARHRVPTLAQFADMFSSGGLKTWLRNLRLRTLLRREHVTAVSNHNLNASRALVEVLGVRADRVVPRDWRPLDCAPPRRDERPSPRPKAVFAGMLSEAKGVGDCLMALRHLRAKGIDLTMTFAGAGPVDDWRNRAESLGLGDGAEFAGLLPHDEVRRRMMAADLVVVPSRHEYAEGLPNVIYEALAARTPLVISDHPAFRGRLEDGRQAVVFRAADPKDLARAMAAVLRDAALWRRLVDASEAAHAGLYFGVEWTELIDLFVTDPTDESGWVARHSLAAMQTA